MVITGRLAALLDRSLSKLALNDLEADTAGEVGGRFCIWDSLASLLSEKYCESSCSLVKLAGRLPPDPAKLLFAEPCDEAMKLLSSAFWLPLSEPWLLWLLATSTVTDPCCEPVTEP